MRTVRVGVTAFPGYVSHCFYETSSVFTDCPNPGISVDAFRIFAEKLKNTFMFRLIPLKNETARFGTWGALKYAFETDLIDLSLDLRSYQPERAESADFLNLPLFYTEKFFLMSQKGLSLSRETKFSFLLPINLLCILVVFSALFSATETWIKSNGVLDPAEAATTLLDYLSALHQPSAIDRRFRRIRNESLRLLRLVWIVGGFLFTAHYLAWWRTDIVVVPSEPFRDYQGFAKAVAEKRLTYFNNPQDGWTTKVLQGRLPTALSITEAFKVNPPVIKHYGGEELLDFLDSSPDFVTGRSELMINRLRKAHRSRACEVFAMQKGERDPYGGLHLVFRKRYPYWTEMNQAVLEISGVVDRHLRRIHFIDIDCGLREDGESEAFSLRYLRNVFRLLIAGIMISFVCLVSEIGHVWTRKLTNWHFPDIREI